MWEGEGSVVELGEEERWQLLRHNSLARLALSAAGEIDIFPVNYYADGETLLLRTAPGTKLLELTVNSHVAVEIDGFTDEDAWSVVVKGTARRLERQAEIDEADQTPLVPWIPTLKYIYVRITPAAITGRRFERAPEPERY
ncbi:pyridoxamine 5'-phosphate oxidase family protein [Marisediminicola antarctica]|uniref:Pyridoxamine 5-phosphate oxidase n=1 Tax=Marisediminicola antarctica TaxID=674079 RepID=A0A7L5AJN5_9MICO|nr:pyridoxamine 5'-phosphate oxidase family protein [Marisediminicola antarctica]QHO68509.1 pyridoxamine 5-phosphate oxidase [Marisediminicola antarctica]